SNWQTPRRAWLPAWFRQTHRAHRVQRWRPGSRWRCALPQAVASSADHDHLHWRRDLRGSRLAGCGSPVSPAGREGAGAPAWGRRVRWTLAAGQVLVLAQGRERGQGNHDLDGADGPHGRARVFRRAACRSHGIHRRWLAQWRCSMTSTLQVRVERPALSYDEACVRFEALLRADTDAVDPESRSRLITPGHRSERAIVLFHGLTNSPRQMLSLSERFTRRAYAVFLPRMPYHGYLDRMTTDQARLCARDLVDIAAMSVDLAAGLADEVTVSGISLGGVLAIWAAQFRGVGLAAPIAPSIGS